MDYAIRALTMEDRDLLYTWRNTESIRINMYDDRVIPYETHCRWFDNTLLHYAAYCRLFLYHSQPLGFISFKTMDEGSPSTYNWGFYLGVANLPKGTGTIMGRLALDYAFSTLKADAIIGEVLSFNQKSAGFHRKLGFIQDHLYQNTVDRDGQNMTILRFKLDKETWQCHRMTLGVNF